MNSKTLRGMNEGNVLGIQFHVELISKDEYPHLACVPGHEGMRPIFRVNDLLEVFNHRPEALLRKVPEDEKLMRKVFASGQRRKQWFVTKQGLYRLMMRSYHPKAEKFIRWITYEVLPSIESEGLYCGDAASLKDARMRSTDYMALRGIGGSPHGFGHRVLYVCRKSGLGFDLSRNGRANKWPVKALDMAAEGLEALRGPLAKADNERVFLFKAG